MTLLYPPGYEAQTFKRFPARHRADLVQQAWLAHLEGQNPIRIVERHAKRERRHEKREACASQLPDGARRAFLALTQGIGDERS